MENTMKNRMIIMIILWALCALIVFSGGKNTNKNKNRGKQGLEGTWTAEIEKWQNPGENKLTFSRKAEGSSSKDISADVIAANAAPSGQPAAQPAPPSDSSKPKEDAKKRRNRCNGWGRNQ